MAERRLGNRARCNAMSAAYEALVRFGSFGQFDRFYRAVAGEVDESPGARSGWHRPTGVPLDFVFGNLEGTRIRRFFLGVYTLLSARKPAAA